MTEPALASEPYDTFISYRSHSSGVHARQIRSALAEVHGYRADVAPLRVFLDRISLRAGQLDERILIPLRSARSLIVLLDETTHESEYVNKEIQAWLAAGGSPDRLFLVRTSAALDLSWNDQTRNFTQPAALPTALAGVFQAQQKYIDFIVPPRRVEEIDIVGLYCAVRPDADPEQLGIDARAAAARKRASNRRIIAVLSGLLVLALIAGVLALTNYFRADASARQARADALAAESLLTLQASPARSIELAVSAAKLGEGSSIRSAMLAVAADSTHLQGTFSLTSSSRATGLAGLSLSAGDKTLTAWGPTPDATTDVITWDSTSRQVMQQFTIPRRRVDALTEIPGVAYLACAEGDALRLDWRTHAVQVLHEQTGHCEIVTYATGAAIVIYPEREPSTIIAVTVTGRELRTTGSLPLDRGRDATRLEVLGLDGRVTGLLTGRGIVPIPPAQQGYVASVDDDIVLLSGDDGRFHALAVVGGELVHTEFSAPAAAMEVIGWQSPDGKPQIAWITATGELGWSGSPQTLQLAGDQPSNTPALGKSLDRFAGNSLATYGIATFGKSAFRIEATDKLAAVRIAGDLPELQQWTSSSGRVLTCGVAAIIGEDAYVVGDGNLIRGSAHLRNCQAVEPGPPIRVNGLDVVEAGYAADRLMDVADSGDVFLAREDGSISHFSGIDDGASPWRVTNADGVMTSEDGSVLFRDSAGSVPMAMESVATGQQLPPGMSGSWVAPRPDGRGGIFADKGQWLGQVDEIPRMLVPGCMFTRFEPAPGFLTDARAAEAQWPIGSAGQGRVDCLTGETLPPAPAILSYRMGSEDGQLLSVDEGLARLTTWRRGESAASSSDLPGVHPEARHGAVTTAGDRVAIGAGESAELVEYRRVGNRWESGNRYVATAGEVGAAAYSPDGSLLLAASPRGHFDIFDTATGRRLASQRTPLTTGAEQFDRLVIREKDGYLVANLQHGSQGQVIEIPVGVEPLKTLLCRVHPAEDC